MRKHPQLQSGRFTNDFTKKDYERLWSEITTILNNVPGGSTKDWKGWRKVGSVTMPILIN